MLQDRASEIRVGVSSISSSGARTHLHAALSETRMRQTTEPEATIHLSLLPVLFNSLYRPQESFFSVESVKFSEKNGGISSNSESFRGAAARYRTGLASISLLVVLTRFFFTHLSESKQ